MEMDLCCYEFVTFGRDTRPSIITKDDQMLLLYRCFVCCVAFCSISFGLVLAQPTSSPIRESTSLQWQVTKRWSLAQGPYQWEVGSSYGLVGHVLQGCVTVFDTQAWKKIRAKSFGQGQVYVAVQGSWGLVALTTQKKLLLVSLPFLRVHRTYPLSFYPYGVHLEATHPTTRKGRQPSSQPTRAKKHSPTYAMIADQIGGMLIRLHLGTGKIVRRQKFRWPLRTRWSGVFGVLVPLSGPLLLLDPGWSVKSQLRLPGVVGDIALQHNKLALAYGDTKRHHGSLHLYQLPKTKPIWRASTDARPRSLAFAGSHLVTLSERGLLQYFSPQGKTIQNKQLGTSGLVIRCSNRILCSALLPMERKIVKLQLQ